MTCSGAEDARVDVQKEIVLPVLQMGICRRSSALLQ